MKTTILLLAVLCCAYALPPHVRVTREPSQEPRVDNLPYDVEDRGIKAINALFDQLIQNKSPSEPLYNLLKKYRDILFAASADRELSWAELNRKYSADIYDALEEYAGTLSDQKERNTLLSILAVSREIAAKQTYNPISDKAAILSFVRQLFNLGNEGLFGIKFKLLPNEQKEQEEFLIKLEAVLDYLLRP